MQCQQQIRRHLAEATLPSVEPAPPLKNHFQCKIHHRLVEVVVPHLLDLLRIQLCLPLDQSLFFRHHSLVRQHLRLVYPVAPHSLLAFPPIAAHHPLAGLRLLLLHLHFQLKIRPHHLAETPHLSGLLVEQIRLRLGELKSPLRHHLFRARLYLHLVRQHSRLVWDRIQIRHLGRHPLQGQRDLGGPTNSTKASAAWVVVKPNHVNSMRKDSAGLEQTADTVMTLLQILTAVVSEITTPPALVATMEDSGQIHLLEVRDAKSM
jgi:hypothetical protein